jgi:hypothetical protein
VIVFVVVVVSVDVLMAMAMSVTGELEDQEAEAGGDQQPADDGALGMFDRGAKLQTDGDDRAA